MSSITKTYRSLVTELVDKLMFALYRVPNLQNNDGHHLLITMLHRKVPERSRGYRLKQKLLTLITHIIKTLQGKIVLINREHRIEYGITIFRNDLFL